MQRRAKLGRISLLAFLKKFQFDARGKIATYLLLPLPREAALESQDRSKVSSSASEIIRRMSLDRSLSSEHRGRRSGDPVKLATVLGFFAVEQMGKY
jgi:hypothetical protein